MNLLLALTLIICALPVVASASEYQATERPCSWTCTMLDTNAEKVEILEAGTCQTKGYVKYKCTAWFGRCGNTWIQEEYTVTCHTSEVEAKDPTCTETGNTAGIVCTDCGQNKTRCAYCAEHMCEVKSETGHTEVAKPDTAPTCVKPGTDGGTWCSVCKTIIQEPTEIDPTGIHNYSKFVKNLVEPSCVNRGKDLYSCATCDDTQERETVFGTHVYDLQRYQVGKAPTCTTGGVGVFKCKYCNIPEVGISVDPLGHDKQYSTLKAPTCTEEGWRIVTCGREGCDYETAEKVAANGHTFETTVNEKPATCTSDGYTAHKKCNDCDATEGKEVIDTDGHKFVNYICSECGVRDGSCLHESAVITIKNSTCNAAGKETFNCPNCGYHYEKALSKLDYHNYVNGVCSWCGQESCKHTSTHEEKVAATCTAPGYKKIVCDSCGKVTNTEVYPSEGHDFDNNDVVHNFCTRCGVANPNAVATDKLTGDLQDIFTLG